MGTRRVTYILALAGSILFCALYPHWFSWYLLVTVLFIAPFDLLISVAGMASRRIWMSAPRILRRGDFGVCAAVTYRKNIFPCGRIKARLIIRGEGFSVRRRLWLSPEDSGRCELPVDTSLTGVTYFRIKRIYPTSLFGLFSVPIAADCSASTLVLPQPSPPSDIPPPPEEKTLRPKMGGGLSEDADLRPYRPGDPVKLMHWKLTAKRDEPIIREPLLPLPHSRMVRAPDWNGAAERDLILGRLLWVSGYLLEKDMPYYVKLGENGQIREITQPNDILEYLYSELTDTPHTLPPPAEPPSRYEWMYVVANSAPLHQADA